MKKEIKKVIPKNLFDLLVKKYHKRQLKDVLKSDTAKYKKYSFGIDDNINSIEQLDARLIKAYHSIEKGLSYSKLRLGFGQSALEDLIAIMRTYKKMNYTLDRDSYRTAVSTLARYVEIHEENNYDVSELKKVLNELGGTPNERGGVIELSKELIMQNQFEDFEHFSNSRHSIRDYSEKTVSLDIIQKAIDLAQNTPSACNRQSWKVRVVSDDKLKEILRNNQNGNRGFGEKIDKFIIITSDYQYYSRPRERNQAQIDGGMYAMNLLYSLHYHGLATIPLSASLSLSQEVNLREAFEIYESELFIMFIGIGNYLETSTFKVPKSSRNTPNVTYFTSEDQINGGYNNEK